MVRFENQNRAVPPQGKFTALTSLKMSCGFGEIVIPLGKGSSVVKILVLSFCMRHRVGTRHHLEIEKTYGFRYPGDLRTVDNYEAKPELDAT